MNIEEAIKHAEEVVKEKEKLANTYESFKDYGNPKSSITSGYKECLSCAEEHRQLAEWLKDYKRLLEQEPCDDAVSRDAVHECIDEAWMCSKDAKEMADVLEKMVNALPPVTPQQKTGKWLVDLQTATEDYYVCSECGRRIHLLYPDVVGNYPFCHCGAKMVEIQERSKE